ncbi:unnamed protein product, partial [Ectocarpus fasciculatus]
MLKSLSLHGFGKGAARALRSLALDASDGRNNSQSWSSTQVGFKSSLRTHRQQYARYISVVRANDDSERLLRSALSALVTTMYLQMFWRFLLFSLIPASNKTKPPRSKEALRPASW